MRQLKKEVRLEIVPTFLGAHAVPRELSPDEYLDVVVTEMLPRVTAEKLAEFCDVFCERGYFNIDQSRKILSAAKKLGLSLRGHVDQLTNSGGAKLMAEMGATTADHLEQTDEQGIAALKKANVQPVLLPGSVYALGSSRYPRAREMIEAGLADRACDRFQSRIVANSEHADGSVPRVHANENVACGSDHRVNRKRSIQPQPRRLDWLPRTWQTCEFRDLRLRRLS